MLREMRVIEAHRHKRASSVPGVSVPKVGKSSNRFNQETHLSQTIDFTATNCVHATRNLHRSLVTLRRIFREDGALTLVEIIRKSSNLT